MPPYQQLPKLPGVYLFKNDRGEIIYVGKAKSLRDRVSSYFQPPSRLLPKTAQMVAEASSVDHIPVESEVDALLLEANLIRRFQPKYNVGLKDGKNYPFIEISFGDKYPFVRLSRKEDNSKSVYFGPYPPGSDIVTLLRFLRRVFPYLSQNHPGGRVCLRSHLGLCPCPAVFNDRHALTVYRRDLRRLRDFLAGKRQAVQKNLTKDMLAASTRQDFETAAAIKKQLATISFVTQSRTRAWEYETNPNLLQDKNRQQLNSLAKTLRLRKLNKIECYDISNTAGRLATAAQVTFVDGTADKSLYRRYKIRLKQTPDDFAMLVETLTRRLKSTVSLPQLIVIDGGKGQLSSVMEIFTKKGAPSPRPKIIALAKRLETIYTDDGREIRLPESSPALHLLQQLRDEAHRFSRKYHFLLRRRSMLT